MTSSTLTRAGLLVLAVGFLVMVVGGGSRFAIGLVLKPVAEDLDWPRAAFGGAAAIFLVVTSSSMVLSGRLVDRFSLPAVRGGGLAVLRLSSVRAWSSKTSAAP